MKLIGALRIKFKDSRLHVVLAATCALAFMTGCMNATLEELVTPDSSFMKIAINGDTSINLEEGVAHQITVAMEPLSSGIQENAKAENLSWTLEDANGDFEVGSGSFVVNATTTSVSFIIKPLKDSLIEADEKFILKFKGKRFENIDDSTLEVIVTDKTTRAVLVPSVTSFDFGARLKDAVAEGSITLSNTGDAAAGNLVWSSLNAPFAYKGGSFPGIGGTCNGTSIDGHSSCTIAVTYQPTEVNSHNSVISWTYKNPDEDKSGSVSLTGFGVEVSATLGGLPTNPSNVDSLNISVGGFNITDYKFKLGPAGSTDCSTNSGYSAETPIATLITNSLTSFSNQNLKICVVGKDSNGLWQPYTAATSHSWALDTVRPTLTINQKSGQTDPTSALPIRYTVTFSEPISESSFTNADVNFSGTASVNSFTISKIDSTHYEIIVAVLDADGSVVPVINADQILDLAGNLNTVSSATDNSVLYDSTSPAAATLLGWAQSSPTNAVPMTATWTLSSSSDVSAQRVQFYQDAICLTPVGSLIPVGSSTTTQSLVGVQGTTYTYKVTSIDPSGNLTLSGCSSAIVFDSSAPSVLSFTPATAIRASLPTSVAVKFNKDMSATSLTTAANWAVQCSGSGAVSIAGISASDSDEATLNLNVDVAPANGEICSVRAKSGLTDSAGNSMTADALVNYTLDLPGSVLAVNSAIANGSYKAGDVITITVLFSEAVTVDSALPLPTLALELGSTDRAANYVSGTGSSTLTFSYTVAAGDNSSDLEYESSSSLSLNGGSIKDSFGSAMSIALPAPGNTGSLSFNKNIVIDTQAPDAFDIRGITGGTDATEDEWMTNGTEASVHWNPSLGVDEYIAEIRSANGSTSVCAPVSTAATDHTFTGCSLTNGISYQLTLKSRDAVGNETVAANSPYVFTVNTSAVIATLTNQPSGRTNQTVLNITVGGNDIVSYRYKVGPSASTVCANAAGYSSDIVVSTHITDDVVGLGSAALRLCVIGKNTAGVEQLMASATSATWTQDLTAPTLTINQKVGQADPTNAVPMEFTVIASEALSPGTFTVADITQTGSATGVSWNLTTSDNITFSLKATGATVAGTITPTVAAAKFKDIAGNDNLASTSTDNTVTYELTRPTLTINQKSGQADPTNTLPVEFTIVFSEPIDPTSFTIGDLVQNGTASAITWVLTTSDNTTYNLAATAVSIPGTLMPSMAAVKIYDVAGNANFASTSTDNSVTYDLTAPSNASTLAWQQSSPTNVTSLVAQWTKSSSSDLASQKIRFYSGSSCGTYTGTETSLAASATTANFTGTHGSTYTFEVISIDSAGNSATSTCSAAITIDTAVPTITNVTSNKTDGAYTIGSVIDVRVTFSENVTVTGTPALALNTTPARSATYASGSGSSTLVFNYTVAASDTVADLNYAGTTALTIASASIKDAASNDATLTLPGLAATGSLGTNKNIIIDTTAPSISSFTVTNTSPTNSTTYNLTSAVAGSPIEYCILANNTSVGSCTWIAGTSLPASFTVSSVNESKTLSAWVRDAAGNVSARASSAAITYDDTPPTATLSGQPTGSTNAYVLNINVGGTDVVAYKYKIGPTASVDCSTSTGYSASEVSDGINITNNISALANGVIKLCVIARDTAGNWQTEASSTSVTWTKASPNVQFTSTTSSISEFDDPTHEVAVSIPSAAAVAVSVNYAFTDGSSPTATKNTDYTGVNGTITIPAGSTSATISIPIIDNPAEENDEKFVITISSPVGSYLGTNTTHTVTILDDEEPPLVTIQDVYVIEGASTSLSATLSHPTDKGSVVVSWKRDTCTGTDCAVATTDYTMTTTSGSATIAAGGTSVTFGSVTTVNNAIDELFKRIPISITGVTGGTSYVSKADIFINDNDIPSGKNVTQMATGYNYTCGLAGNGKVYCWGHNNVGQLGVGDYYSRMTPTEVILPALATKLAASREMGCAILSDASLYCWGRGAHGSDPGAYFLGNGSGSHRSTPVLVTGMTASVTDVGLFVSGGCALQSGGVKCWGSQIYGLFGDPDTVAPPAAPIAISGLTSGVTKLSVGWTHACAIKSSTLYCWGQNIEGELGLGHKTLTYTPTAVAGLGTVTDVWAGHLGTCAKNSTNAIYCWGNNGDWQIVSGTTTDQLSPVLMPDFAGATMMRYGPTLCGLVSGALKCKGRNYYGEMGLNEPANNDISPLTTMPGATSGVTTFTVSAEGHTCFVKSNQAYCTGFSGYGQLGDDYAQQSTAHVLAPDYAGASSVSIGSEGGCGLFSGAVKCMGDNTYWRLGNTIVERILYGPAVIKTLETGVTKMEIGQDGGCGLKSGSLYCWGRYMMRAHPSSSGNTNMTLTGVTDFVGGPSSNILCAVKSGQVYCWGDMTSFRGALGYSNTAVTYTVSVSSSAGTNNTRAAPGGLHICLLKTDKTVWCAGYNSDGQLGQGTTTESATPLKVPGVTAVDELASSSRGSCARSGTTVKCWGEMPGDGTSQVLSPVTVSLTGVTRLVGGFNAYCAIAAGKAYCWGNNRENHHGLDDAATSEYHYSPTALTTLNAKGTVTDMSIGTYGTCGKVGTNWYCSGADITGNLGSDKKPNRLGAVSIAPF